MDTFLYMEFVSYRDFFLCRVQLFIKRLRFVKSHLI